jgi:hypothetical protein
VGETSLRAVGSFGRKEKRQLQRQCVHVHLFPGRYAHAVGGRMQQASCICARLYTTPLGNKGSLAVYLPPQTRSRHAPNHVEVK